jgi:hypothetical protein
MTGPVNRRCPVHGNNLHPPVATAPVIAPPVTPQLHALVTTFISPLAPISERPSPRGGDVGTSHNHTDGETPSIIVRRTGILLDQQTPCSECRQYSYTATRGRPIQALANQRTQLQLRLQLARK